MFTFDARLDASHDLSAPFKRLLGIGSRLSSCAEISIPWTFIAGLGSIITNGDNYL